MCYIAAAMASGDVEPGRWLLLIHQLPPRPSYLRVRVWRRLQALGAVAIKSTVYALPVSDRSREDFAWVVQEVTREGGEASVCEARFVDGLDDAQIEALFTTAREADYRRIGEDVEALSAKLPRGSSAPLDEVDRLAAELSRLQRKVAEVAAIDFFAAAGRDDVEQQIARVARALRPPEPSVVEPARLDASSFRGRTWATRKGVHVDRIACAWLVRRFVDPDARFVFVAQRGYRPEPGVIRFDMFEGELTHEGDRCTFEVMCERFGLTERALTAIAEIVHDIDLKDGKFGRVEAAGIDRLLLGLAMSERDDERRLARGGQILDELYAYFQRKRDHPAEEPTR